MSVQAKYDIIDAPGSCSKARDALDIATQTLTSFNQHACSLQQDTLEQCRSETIQNDLQYTCLPWQQSVMMWRARLKHGRKVFCFNLCRLSPPYNIMIIPKMTLFSMQPFRCSRLCYRPDLMHYGISWLAYTCSSKNYSTTDFAHTAHRGL